MKRTFVLVSLVLSLVLLLSGCDKILESFFPNFGEKGTFGDNTINVKVEIDKSITGMPEFYQKPIIVAAVPFVENPVGSGKWEIAKDRIWIKDFWGQSFIQDNFSPLPPGKYRVFVWFDLNDDRLPNFEEPSLLATAKDPSGKPFDQFDFVEGGTVKVFDTGAYLGIDNRMPPEIISLLNPTAVDNSFHIQGTPVIDKNWLSAPWFMVFPHNDQPVKSIKWRINRQWDWQQVLIYGFYDNTILNDSWFQVDFTSATPDFATGTTNDDYVLGIDVTYGNDATWHIDYLLKLIEESTWGAFYNLVVDIVGLEQDPVQLVWDKNYQFSVEFYGSTDAIFILDDPSIAWFIDRYIVNRAIYNGGVNVNISNDPMETYGQLSYLHSPGLLGVRVVIDTNDDGNLGNIGDWETFIMPVVLGSGQTEFVVAFNQWAFFPINQ